MKKGETYRIAFSSFGSKAAPHEVSLAVVGGGDQVHEVSVGVGPEPVVLGLQHPASVLALLLHLVGAVELFLQHGSDLEKKQLNFKI